MLAVAYPLIQLEVAMSVLGRTTQGSELTTRLVRGALAGVAGGVIFGMMMGMMGMLPMIAGLVGSSSAVVGFIVHLVISAIIGAIYGLTLGAATTSWANALGFGALYGAIWWVLGPLLIMPTMMGMGPQLTPQAMSEQMMSLMGHLIYGLGTGAAYLWLKLR